MGSGRAKNWLWAAGVGAAAACAFQPLPAVARDNPGRPSARLERGDDAAPSRADLTYIVRHDHWTADDERGYGEFIAAIGESNCRTVDSCLKGPANPFRASDADDAHFQSDCADLPYYLRGYYAWKRGLPFAYEAAVAPLGPTNDIRYSPDGNEVTARRTVTTGSTTGPALLNRLRNSVSSAMYRIHPDRETPIEPDLYSPALTPKAIRLGTVIYDPNGHLAIIYRIEKNGRILYIDAHPDNSLTRGPYDKRFVRSRPGMGAGFKNWRPIALKDYTQGPRGALLGGTIVAAPDRDIADFSDEQYFGNGRQRVADANWAAARFTLNGESLDYYDYVRAKLGGGSLKFDPINELREMVRSNCADLHYRADAVTLGLQAGLQNQPHPERLPYNIYGTNGDWETYSTPSRDARLKTAFKEVRDTAERFVRLRAAGDSKLVYAGGDLVGDLLAAYDQESAACTVSYRKSDGATVTIGYEDARMRLFRMSFDPYQCVELRWGADDADELKSCRDGETKRDWYGAEQALRNQTDRTYEARMDHDLAELRAPGGEGKGVAEAPDIDVRGYLLAARTRGAMSGSAAHEQTPQEFGGERSR
jgi:hypothetical protein